MQLGRYELQERLASGGMGEIFRARVTGAAGFEKIVAVKRIFPHLATDPEYRHLFAREAKLAANLQHPNIVQVFELGETENELYIAMELVPGIDLAHLLSVLRERKERLTPPLAAAIAFDLLTALVCAHSRAATDEGSGVVHRDVSPSNVLISVDGFVKLCDFGIAQAPRSEAASPASFQGKVPYAAPEHLMGNTVDGRADVFSVGLLTYEMAAGRRLFQATSQAEQQELFSGGASNALDGHRTPDDLRGLIEVVFPALHIDPRRRYPSAAAFRDAVEDFLVRAGPRGARAALAETVSQICSDGQNGHAAERTRTVGASDRWTVVLSAAENEEARTIVATVPMGRMTERRYRILDRFGKRGPRLAIALAMLLGLGAGVWSVLSPPSAESEQAGDTGRAPALQGVAETDLPGVGGAGAVADPVAPHEPLVPIAETGGRVSSSSVAPRATSRSGRAKATGAARRKRVSRGAPGILNINAKPWAHVVIDGKRLNKTTPLLNHQIAAGSHVIRLEGPNNQVRELRIRVAPREVVTRFVKLE